MAEYYPLLAKAVAGLPNSTIETRRAVYERARKALLGQLQNLQPPLPDDEIARETQALDMAMARLEAELATSAASQSDAPTVAEPRLAAAITGGSSDLRPMARAFPRAPAPSRRANGPAAGPAISQPKNSEAETVNAEPDHRYGNDDASPIDFTAAEPPRARSEFMRPEAVRPLAPQPQVEDTPQSRRMWIVIGVVVIIVGMVAAAAWKLRDRADHLTAFNSAPQSQAAHGAGKIVERIGASPSQEASPSASPASQPAATPAASAAKPATQAAIPAASSAPQATDSGSSVPVAYRAAFLVEAPNEPNKLKTYVGTVIWRLENVSNDTTQPPATAVRADIDVPEDKLKATLEIQKNTDPNLSASHTITIVFTIAPDSPTGSIKQIGVPQLRAEDTPNGQPLRGSLVPIMDNSFLIGLNRGDDEAANIDLIKQREWFDIPILLNNGHVAKLTFEKNASGDRAIQEAFASWQGQQ